MNFCATDSTSLTKKIRMVSSLLWKLVDHLWETCWTRTIHASAEDRLVHASAIDTFIHLIEETSGHRTRTEEPKHFLACQSRKKNTKNNQNNMCRHWEFLHRVNMLEMESLQILQHMLCTVVLLLRMSDRTFVSSNHHNNYVRTIFLHQYISHDHMRCLETQVSEYMRVHT